jgi:hypothetical protein
LHRRIQLQRSGVVLLRKKLRHLRFVDVDELAFQGFAVLVSRVARENRPVQR